MPVWIHDAGMDLGALYAWKPVARRLSLSGRTVGSAGGCPGMAEHSPEDLRRLDVLGRIIAAVDERSTNPQALPQDLLGAGTDHASAQDLRERVRELGGAGYVTVD